MYEVNEQGKSKPNVALREARFLRCWSQQDLADQLGTTAVTVKRWERGSQQPSAYFRLKLCTLFGKSAEALGLLPSEVSITQTDDIDEQPDSFPYDPILSSSLSETRHLIGRNELVDQFVQTLCTGRGSFAITGLPGVGKTALALALAHHPKVRQQFRDGILWVGLGQDPHVLESMSRWGILLGLTTTHMETLTTVEAWGSSLHECIGRRRMLVVIDDAWQLSHAVTFRLGGSDCVHLLTTRFPSIALPFAQENVSYLQELNEEASLALLQCLAPEAIESGFSIRELVQSVGGLPLALTLIGRYLHVQAQYDQPRRLRAALNRLLQNVKERLQLAEPHVPWEYASSLPMSTALSLQATIAISEHSLPETAQKALYALSVFPPKPYSFLEEAALAVCQMDEETLDLLVDSGLLETAQPGRYYLHQTIADYAKIQCTDNAVEKRMVEFFVHFVQKYHNDHEMLDQELHNIIVAFDMAFERGMFDVLLQGILTLAPFIEARRLYSLASALFTRAQQIPSVQADLESATRLWLSIGKMAELKSDLLQAEEAYLEGLKAAKQFGDVRLLVKLLVRAGSIIMDRDDPARAKVYLVEGFAIAKELDEREQMSTILKQLGEVADYQGYKEKAASFFLEGLILAQQLENWRLAGALLQNLGALAVEQGAFQQAAMYYQQGMAYAQQCNDVTRQSAILMTQGMLAFLQEQYQEAITLSLESLRLARTIENRFRISSVLQNLGMLEGVRANYVQAESYLEESLRLAQETGHRWLICETQGERGVLYLRRQKFERAKNIFHSMLLDARSMEAPLLVAQALFGLAQAEAGLGNRQDALCFAKESLALFEQLKSTRNQQVISWMESIS